MTEDKPDPLAQHRAVMKQLLIDSGPEAIIGYIQGFDSDPLRRVLYISAKEVVAPADSEGKDLEALIIVSESALAELDRQAEETDDAEEQAGILHADHIVSYNLAAELADCWPGDDLPRNEEHHRRGVRAAKECLTISEPAGRPRPIANDLWVRGIHELALGEVTAAAESWTRASEYAREAAEVEGAAAAVGADAPFLVNLLAGYLGIANLAAGDPGAMNEYEAAIAAFRSQADDAEKRQEVLLGIGQLEKTMRQYGSEGNM